MTGRRRAGTTTMRPWRSVLLAAMLALAVGARAAAPESERIDALIAAVEHADGAVFVRNGAEHDPHAAADHLRLKRRNAGTRAATAEAFIACCASHSSTTGRKYTIKFKDGSTVDAETFFREALEKFDAGKR